MNLYAHAILANELLPLARPANAAEFIWGSVALDIRYLAAMRWETTHLPNKEIASLLSRYPGCESLNRLSVDL